MLPSEVPLLKYNPRDPPSQSPSSGDALEQFPPGSEGRFEGWEVPAEVGAAPAPSQLSEILGMGALARLEVGPELVHVIQGLGKESPGSVDLHQG